MLNYDDLETFLCCSGGTDWYLSLPGTAKQFIYDLSIMVVGV
jgi:hypothetical protein